RVAVLDRCAQNVLAESWAIEKLGMTFCAKMGLLVETLEEKMAYCLMGSDEAAHLHAVSPYLRDHAAAGGGPFFELMEGAVEERSPNVLQFLIQNVLEGWGLTHYRELSARCTDAGLRRILERVVADEAFHHGTGVLLFDPRRLDDGERRFMQEFLV